MDPPKCRLCQKHHWGSCAEGLTVAAKPDSPGGRKRPEKKSMQKFALSGGNAAGLELLEELLGRLESLEGRVLELESRKKYMKKYMADKRAEEK